jgi:hypothetical protein
VGTHRDWKVPGHGLKRESFFNDSGVDCGQMLNLQRKHIGMDTELRVYPRIEFHYPVAIIGIDANAQIIDFSLNGFYVETDQVDEIKMDQKINLALKLSDEKILITVKAKIVHRDKSGFGCKFWNPNPEVITALERCFDLYAGMLPIE